MRKILYRFNNDTTIAYQANPDWSRDPGINHASIRDIRPLKSHLFPHATGRRSALSFSLITLRQEDRMKRTYEDILGDYYEDLDEDLEVSENQLKKVIKTKKRRIPQKFYR